MLWANTNIIFFLLESYSIAGSDGSISASVASIQPQPSTSSAPSSPGSRRSVSTLKKWLTNPVRKLSSGSRLDQRQKKIESRPKRGLPGRRRSADDGGRGSFDLGVLRKMEDFTRPEDRSLVRTFLFFNLKKIKHYLFVLCYTI